MAADAARVVLDAAGGTIGGAARWHAELSSYLDDNPEAVEVIGQGRCLTPAWLLRREYIARGAGLVVAPNNVSFVTPGAERRVLLRNALHFLRPDETHLLARMPRSFRMQVRVVRWAAARADVVVAPSSDMAERVIRSVPAVRNRIVVRAHPVTTVGDRRPAPSRFVLVPVVPGPFKNLVPELRLLVQAVSRGPEFDRIVVTARASELPLDLADHPLLETIGRVTHRDLSMYWREAAAVFYPSVTESFGYPLAEARCYGIPVIAPDTAQASEIAGSALCGYRSADLDSLVDALVQTEKPVTADPDHFDRRAYFDWLLDSTPARPGLIRPRRDRMAQTTP
jgi:glycosyltransferase involved in cell wall biosynthesis